MIIDIFVIPQKLMHSFLKVITNKSQTLIIEGSKEMKLLVKFGVSRRNN